MSLPKLELTTHAEHSVFNHYNRVHANLESQSDARYGDHGERMSELPSIRSKPRLSICIPETEPEITTAQLQPYPRRTRSIPFVSPPGHGLPLFEKSNVLVMYATNILFCPVICIT